MSPQRRLVVVGTVAENPYAGMAWMTMQLTAGLRRLGHDVYYLEVTSRQPYDPDRRTRTTDSSYPLAYLARLASRFGLENRWAYRRSYDDGAWYGLPASTALEVLATADAAFNVAGSTGLAYEGLATPRWILYGTDPVIQEIRHASGSEATRIFIDEHDDVVTYGENIGGPACPLPPLPRLRAHTRQPVLLDFWEAGPPRRAEYTTVANWRQADLDLNFGGSEYLWSKHHEFLKFIGLPGRTTRGFELATNLAPDIRPKPLADGRIKSLGLSGGDRALLSDHGWLLEDAPGFTTDPWAYRDYITASRGEFAVARDLNVRTRSGWFSERSACYLAAGRPVVTQDTGFGTVLPTGEGLFAVQNVEEAAEAISCIESDYERHARAARDIAKAYFDADVVLPRLLSDLGL